jgi:hypothetical protein
MKESLPASDLFVVLDRAFRRRTRECARCVFTLPYRVAQSRTGGANWSIVSTDCSETCRLILEDLVAQFQRAYHLAEPRRKSFRPRPH